jgi:DNA-binding NarL/FixJ family response regulator
LPPGLGDGDEARSPADKLGIERRPRRSIAELAASGHSNREIARALFVTPKTVEYHLRNSDWKLEIRGRSQLERALGGG